jgi:UDP-N-acetylglucosamine--N-acetylmuramyl-(pentapeptide) pyrophosphoryl-undecaprenol N-acetylglucosamine transferase
MVSRKVYFAVFGSGLGHVTRVLEVARRLRDSGNRFRFSSSGQGLNYLNSNGEERNVVESPSLDVHWAAGGGFSSWHVLPHFPFMFNAFLKQLAFEEVNISRFDPDLVVSDSRLSAVLGARLKSYPAITMLNQFSVAFPPRFRGRVGRFYERIAGDSLGLMWSLSERVLMTDLPPPFTIGERNLVGSDVSRIVEFVGFTSPSLEVNDQAIERARRMLDLDRRPLVFCQISGPDQTKLKLREVLMRAAGDISRDHNLVISLGFPSGSSEPKKLANGAWLFEWCPVKDELFRLSDLLIARAGHSTIGQCINAAKPAILVPIHNHSEQLGNAEKFAKLGLGITIRSEELTPQKLVESVDSCFDDPRYRSNVEALSRVSKRYNGIERCSEIIASFA